MKKFRDLFRRIKIAYDANTRRDASLICKEGFYRGCPVLKLQKAAWTNDDMRIVPNTTGIFFSIWLDEESLRKNRVKYNIHALKLRKLDGYNLTSNKFANDFRMRFEGMRKLWPKVSVDFGPQTLMEGWIDIVDKSLQRDIEALMKRFADISPIIDDLLAKRRRAVAV